MARAPAESPHRAEPGSDRGREQTSRSTEIINHKLQATRLLSARDCPSSRPSTSSNLKIISLFFQSLSPPPQLCLAPVVTGRGSNDQRGRICFDSERLPSEWTEDSNQSQRGGRGLLQNFLGARRQQDPQQGPVLRDG
jgi:hypothetical protein